MPHAFGFKLFDSIPRYVPIEGQGFTYPRDTLEYVEPIQNVTLSLPQTLLRKFRVYAASRNQSMTRVMTEAIQALVEQDQQTANAKRRFIERIRTAPDRGTRGKIRWSREELHER